jgi:hypothetical protein
VRLGDLVKIECNRFTDYKRLSSLGLIGKLGIVISIDETDGFCDVLVDNYVYGILSEYLREVKI